MSNDVYVNYELLDRVRRIKEDELLHDDSYKLDNEVLENRVLTDLYYKAQNFNKQELAVVIGVALEEQPLLVFQVLADYVIDALEKGKRGQKNDKCS